jgi:kynurenine formamidase
LESRTVEAGDALLIHTGWMERWRAGDGGESHAPALAPSASRWIVEQDIAIVGADNPAVEVYGEDDLHTELIRGHGVYLMELLTLAEPVADRVSEGLLVVAPLLIVRGVGSPVNPILIV